MSPDCTPHHQLLKDKRKWICFFQRCDRREYGAGSVWFIAFREEEYAMHRQHWLRIMITPSCVLYNLPLSSALCVLTFDFLLNLVQEFSSHFIFHPSDPGCPLVNLPVSDETMDIWRYAPLVSWMIVGGIRVPKSHDKSTKYKTNSIVNQSAQHLTTCSFFTLTGF